MDGIAETEALDAVARRDLVRRDPDIAERPAVAGHRQIDGVGVVAERGIEEGEVRGHAAGEGAGASAGGGEDRIGRRRRIVARARQHRDRPAGYGGRAACLDEIGLARRIDLDLVDRTGIEGDIAGDVESADRVAGRDGAADDRIRDGTDALQATARQDSQPAAELAVDGKDAVLDGGRAGEAAGIAGQLGLARTDLADRAVADEKAGEGEIVGTVEGKRAGIGDAADDAAARAAIAEAQRRAGRDVGAERIAVVGGEGKIAARELDPAGAGDRPAEGRGIGTVEDKRAVVEHVADDRAGRRCSCSRPSGSACRDRP